MRTTNGGESPMQEFQGKPGIRNTLFSQKQSYLISAISLEPGGMHKLSSLQTQPYRPKSTGTLGLSTPKSTSRGSLRPTARKVTRLRPVSPPTQGTFGHTGAQGGRQESGLQSRRNFCNNSTQSTTQTLKKSYKAE